MKKRFFALLLLAALVFALSVPALAQETENFVFDRDGYLTEEQVLSLNEAAAAVSAENGCGVYVAVFDDMADYGYSDIETFAEAVYNDFSLGYTEDGDGILLVMSMAGRDYDLAAYGDFGNMTFTDYGKETLVDKFLGYFRQNDWAGGFAAYIDGCAELLSYAGSGVPLDVFNAEDYGYDYGYDYGGGYEDDLYTPTRASISERLADNLPIGLVLGLIVALIRGGILKKKMKSAVAATEANEYVCEQGVEMYSAIDKFTHTTVVRQHIDRDSGSRSGGGGGTSVNSSGFSHSSGKF